MKAYVITTGIIFVALAGLHVFVVVGQWRALPSDPWPAIILALAAGFALWAGRVVRIARKA